MSEVEVFTQESELVPQELFVDTFGWDVEYPSDAVVHAYMRRGSSAEHMQIGYLLMLKPAFMCRLVLVLETTGVERSEKIHALTKSALQLSYQIYKWMHTMHVAMGIPEMMEAVNKKLATLEAIPVPTHEIQFPYTLDLVGWGHDFNKGNMLDLTDRDVLFGYDISNNYRYWLGYAEKLLRFAEICGNYLVAQKAQA